MSGCKCVDRDFGQQWLHSILLQLVDILLVHQH